MQEPLVSVILPTYNRAHCLTRAIDSVLAQTYQNIELFVVDDGSTDNTREVIEAIQDARLHYMRTPSNRGVAAARNAGIRRAKGKYIAFQDSDDVWMPEKLAKQVAQLEQAGEAMALSYHIMGRTLVDESRYFIPDPSIQKERRQGRILRWLLAENFIGIPSVCIRREALLGEDGIGVFDTIIPNMEDYEIILRIAKQYWIGYIDEVLIETYELQDGINSHMRKGLVSHCMIIGKYKEDMMRFGYYDLKLSALRRLGEQCDISDWMEENIRKFCKENE